MRKFKPGAGKKKSASESTQKDNRKPKPSNNAPKKDYRKSASGNRRGKKPVELDPALFTKKAVQKEERKYTPTRKIAELPVNQQLVHNLIKKGFEYPTEIQDRSLDSLMSGRDLMGIAQTGTGKTGAFLIPIINELIGQAPHFQALVVVPTRELAVQVEQEFKSITKGLNLYCECFIGGININRDLSALRRKSHLVIGTPGRLIDLGRQRVMPFQMFDTLVLDEFDRLLDMGFLRDIRMIVQAMRNRKQTILFSATEEKSQKQLIGELLEDPAEVRVSNGMTTGDHIDQEVVRIQPDQNKFEVLVNMLHQPEFEKVLVFAETKRHVSNLWKKLHKLGLPVEQIHGDKSQNQRLNALNSFKAGKIRILLATDVAARGLDISEVTHVINYQAPRTMDAYIHRIGRTGRAGKAGKAYTFIQ